MDTKKSDPRKEFQIPKLTAQKILDAENERRKLTTYIQGLLDGTFAIHDLAFASDQWQIVYNDDGTATAKPLHLEN